MSDDLARFEYLNEQGLRKLKDHYKSAKYGSAIDWEWDKKPYNRIAITNFVVSHFADCNYLEIGCDRNDLFHSIPAKRKTGVDPERGGTHRLTSDKFFEQNDDRFDVIFVDGLHYYEQVHRDAANALNALSEDGWLLFHDFLPASWLEEHVPRLQGSWTGDVWKLAFELVQAKGIDFRIVAIDHGVGILKLTGDTVELPDLSSELSSKGFGFFYENHKSLPLIEWGEAIHWISYSMHAR